MTRLRTVAIGAVIAAVAAVFTLPSVASASPSNPLTLSGSYSKQSIKVGDKVSLSLTAKNTDRAALTRLTIIAYSGPTFRFDGDSSHLCQAFTDGGGSGFKCTVSPPTSDRPTTVSGINLTALQPGADIAVSYEFFTVADPKLVQNDAPFTKLPIVVSAQPNPPGTGVLRITGKVAPVPLRTDPSKTASVKLTANVRNPDGSPARGATVVSSDEPRTKLRADVNGDVVITRNVNIATGDSATYKVKLSATSSDGKLKASLDQKLYDFSQIARCNFNGLPTSVDISPFFAIGKNGWDTFAELFYNVGMRGFGWVTTDMRAYLINVTGNEGDAFWGNKTTLRAGSKVLRNGTVFSNGPLFKTTDQYGHQSPQCTGSTSVA
jgi:hypothetical protein